MKIELENVKPRDIESRSFAIITEELGDRGRILVRESGTEPLIRVMVEASDPDDCEKYVDQIVEVLRKNAHIRK